MSAYFYYGIFADLVKEYFGYSGNSVVKSFFGLYVPGPTVFGVDNDTEWALLVPILYLGPSSFNVLS